MKKLTSKNDPMFKKIKALYKYDHFDSDLKIEVLMNELYTPQGALNQISAEWLSFFKFFFESPYRIDSLVFSHLYRTLNYHYGKCDFKFEGNREYRNWLFEHDGVYFIISSKSEYLIPKNKQTLGDSIISMYYELFKLTLEYIEANPNEIHSSILEQINFLKKKKIIFRDNLKLVYNK